jgi:outer membrane murein-binding lipoprotein Lpp
MKRLSAAIVLSSLMLAGCVTPYQPVPFDRTATPVSKIAIVDNTLPSEVGTQKMATNGQNMMSAASSAGLAGLLVGAVAAGIEAGIESGQRERIQKALATQNFNGEAIFDVALEEALKGNNYSVSTIAIPRTKARELVVVPSNEAAEAGSAVLDTLGFNYGFQLVGNSTQWRPFVTMHVRMVDHKDPKKILLDNMITYNPVVKSAVTVSIPVDESFAFQKIEDLEADPVKAAAGLKAAIEATAKATADLLR